MHILFPIRDVWRKGVLILLGAALTLAAFAIPWSDLLARTYPLRIYVPEASGIGEHTRVSIDGIEVGRVQEIRLSTPPAGQRVDPNRRIEISLRLRREIQQEIRDDSKAEFQTAGLLGSREIVIQRGLTGLPIQEGGEVRFAPGKELNLAAVLERLSEIVKCAAEDAAARKNSEATREVR